MTRAARCAAAWLVATLALAAPARAAGPAGIDAGLAMWLRADAGVELQGRGVTAWRDQSGNKRDATQPDPKKRPVVHPTIVNGRPSVAFGRKSLGFDGSFLAGKDYTIFFVAARQGARPGNFFIGGSARQPDSNLLLGYENATTLRMAHYANDLDAKVAPPARLTARIHVFRMAQSSGRTVFRDRRVVATSKTAQHRKPLKSFAGATIGSFPAFGLFFRGFLMEMAVYDRALSDPEVDRISGVMASRWRIQAAPAQQQPPPRQAAPPQQLTPQLLAGTWPTWYRPTPTTEPHNPDDWGYDKDHKWVNLKKLREKGKPPPPKDPLPPRFYEIWHFRADGTYAHEALHPEGHPRGIATGTYRIEGELIQLRPQWSRQTGGLTRASRGRGHLLWKWHPRERIFVLGRDRQRVGAIHRGQVKAKQGERFFGRRWPNVHDKSDIALYAEGEKRFAAWSKALPGRYIRGGGIEFGLVDLRKDGTYVLHDYRNGKLLRARRGAWKASLGQSTGGAAYAIGLVSARVRDERGKVRSTSGNTVLGDHFTVRYVPTGKRFVIDGMRRLAKGDPRAKIRAPRL